MTFQSYAAGGTEFQKFYKSTKNKVDRTKKYIFCLIDKDFSDISQLLCFLKYQVLTSLNNFEHV